MLKLKRKSRKAKGKGPRTKRVREALVLKLRRPNAAKAAWLTARAERFRHAVTWTFDRALEWELPGKRNVLHYHFYQIFRDRFGLLAEEARTAVIEVAAQLAGYDARLALDHQTRPPVLHRPVLGLGVRQHAPVARRGQHVLRVSTEKRGVYIWLPLCVPMKYRDRLAQAKGDAKLFKRGNDWYVMLSVRVTAPTGRSGEPVFIGVDRGIVKHAVVAPHDSSKCKFFSGKEARHRRNHFADLRRRYGSHQRVDRIRASRGKERAWMRDVNHKISKRIVEFAHNAGGQCAVIVLEDLQGIRERARSSRKGRREVSSWAFGQLGDFIEYKARRLGIKVLHVDPRNTSRTCPKCGCVDKRNRRGQQFRCKRCGYQAHADLVAARNIAAAGATLQRQGPTDTARQRDARCQTGQPTARSDGAKGIGCRVQCHSVSDSNLESSTCGTPVL